jgi:hypothetical protein
MVGLHERGTHNGSKHTVVLSPGIVAAYEAVLNRPRFKLLQWVIQELLTYIHGHADWVTAQGKVRALARDSSGSAITFPSV